MMHPADVAKELQTFSFFKTFPYEAILVLATMAVNESYHAGSLLLEQGKSNDSLFFLRSGAVRILVDGELVAEYDGQGEVFGEISIINRQPVSASLVCVGEVEVFRVSERHLNTLPQDEVEKFQHMLYRVYATILAERLVKTSAKAKMFEVANRDLVAAQSTLKKMNEDLETEIQRRSKELVHKIHSLTESHLQPVLGELNRYSRLENLQTISGKEMNLLANQVGEVIDFFKPLVALNKNGQGSGAHRVLLCDSNKKQQNLAKLALGGSGVDLAIASDAEELTALLQEKSFDLVLCEAEMKEAITGTLARAPQTPVVIIVGLEMPRYLQTIKDFPQQNFFISRDVNNRVFTIRNTATTVSKILNKDFFGLEKYLSWGSKIIEQEVFDSATRLEVIETMKEHFRTFGVRNTILDRAHTVTEELLMNAIYDAPADRDGKALYNHKSRTEHILLKPEHRARLNYGTDGVLLGISVTDPFGGLTKEIVTNYLESVYSGHAGELNKNKGGAGRGLHMIIESADLTVFNVLRGKRTEVIVLFHLERAADQEAQPSFHLFLA